MIIAYKIVKKIHFFCLFCLDPGVEDRMSVIWEKGVVSYSLVLIKKKKISDRDEK